MDNKYMVIYEAPATFLKNIHYVECNTEEEITNNVKKLINEGAINIKVAEKIPFEVNIELTR
ncbi:MAG: hypothetical protein K0R54_2084 [Clostridiaceae bacterium]|jgi:hypothetical protein|nr:hypothetical protein [Clostridiaceae bacterium]